MCADGDNARGGVEYACGLQADDKRETDIGLRKKDIVMAEIKYIMSAIPYMGNKYKLLKHLVPLFPKQCNTFYDLFGGSGCVSINYRGGITLYTMSSMRI